MSPTRNSILACGWARGAPFPEAEMAAAIAQTLTGQTSCATTAHAQVTRPGKGTPNVLSSEEGDMYKRKRGRSGQVHPFQLIQPGDQTAQQLQTQHSWSRPTHPAPISGSLAPSSSFVSLSQLVERFQGELCPGPRESQGPWAPH